MKLMNSIAKPSANVAARPAIYPLLLFDSRLSNRYVTSFPFQKYMGIIIIIGMGMSLTCSEPWEWCEWSC